LRSARNEQSAHNDGGKRSLHQLKLRVNSSARRASTAPAVSAAMPATFATAFSAATATSAAAASSSPPAQAASSPLGPTMRQNAAYGEDAPAQSRVFCAYCGEQCFVAQLRDHLQDCVSRVRIESTTVDAELQHAMRRAWGEPQHAAQPSSARKAQGCGALDVQGRGQDFRGAHDGARRKTPPAAPQPTAASVVTPFY
jgi:hypothetical protein